MNKTLKKVLSGVISASMLCSALAIPHTALADDALPTDGLLMDITFDETGTSSGSFNATVGGTVTEHGSVSYVDNYDGLSKALSISTDAAGNYLELPKGLLNGKDAATFSFWIKPSSRWAFMTTPLSGKQTVNQEKYLGMLASSSGYIAERYNNSGTRLSSVKANASGDWQYVTAVFTADGTKVYVNGKLLASDTAAVDIKSLFTADASTWIGHANWGSGEGFSGMIDDFKVYGRALNETEINQLAAKAIQREQEETVKEKNCLDINTQFYTNYSVTESGNNVTVSVPSPSEDKYEIIAASYSNGVLTNAAKKSKSDVTSDKTVTFENIKKNENDTVKVFVWNSIDGLQPLSDNKAFQIRTGDKVKVKTSVTNYTPSDQTVSLKIVPFDKDGNQSESVQTLDSVTLGIMDSYDFTDYITGDSNVSYYKVLVSSTADDKTATYEAGYLPTASVEFPDATPADSADTTEEAHDPTIFKDPVSHRYYAYSTHNLVFESDDLINWEKHDYRSEITVPEKAKKFIDDNYQQTDKNGKIIYPTANTTYWAPDLYYKEGDEYPYWFYLSTSCGFGGRNSVISLIKAKSPGLWDDEYIDAGVVIASKENNNYNTNCIDANIFTDTDGKTYFIWGSFWKGIHIAELDTDTGLVKGIDYTSDETILSSSQKFGTRLFSTPSGVVGPEGPYAVYNKDTGYRYMFTSYGYLGTNYNLRVARTDKTFSTILSNKDPHKQLLDQKNRPVGATYSDQVKEGGSLDELWGYKMSGSFRLGDGIEYVGSGHNSVFQEDDGQWYLVQHCRKVANAFAYLQVKKILWTEDGWPVISPLVYAGEKEQKIPKEMIYGTWDLSSVGHTIMADGVTDVSKPDNKETNYYGARENSDLPVHSSQIILQPDGTIGNGIGTWDYDNDHTVTLNFDADGNNDNYEFYQSGDTMKLFVMTGYDKDKRESAIIMTGTDQNSVASFAKKSNAVSVSTKTVNRIETTPTTITKSTNGNPILGFDADGKTLYAGDPAAYVEDDTVYLYAGHDTSTGDSYVMPEWVCYTSKDMENWEYKGSVMSAKDISWRSNDTSAWASQVIKHNGKYYLYFCTWDKTSSGKHSIGVAVSDSPTGPFTDIGKPLIQGTLTEPQAHDHDDIDPTVWVENVDGVEHRYLAWGNTNFYVCELNDDMISVKDLDEDGSIQMGKDILQQKFDGLPDGLGFTEAPWIYRQQDENGNYTGKYYLFGAFGWREQMGYATSDSMYGPWKWGGIIMEPTATSNTNHPAVIDFNGKTYFIYHNGSLVWGSGFRRSVCVSEMTFNEDGTVPYIDETSTGLTGTASFITTADNKYLGYTAFSNPSDDASYPLKKQLTVTADGADLKTTQWEIEKGKSDSTNENYVSIQAVYKPGLYLCVDGTNVVLTQQDTTSTALAKKMTFKTVEAIDGTVGKVSFESVSTPGYFITVSGDNIILTDGSNTANCSFSVTNK